MEDGEQQHGQQRHRDRGRRVQEDDRVEQVVRRVLQHERRGELSVQLDPGEALMQPERRRRRRGHQGLVVAGHRVAEEAVQDGQEVAEGGEEERQHPRGPKSKVHLVVGDVVDQVGHALLLGRLTALPAIWGGSPRFSHAFSVKFTSQWSNRD